MYNFSFCYEKPYCTYTVLLFLAHADHCLHPTVPTHQISARQSQTHQISQLAARTASKGPLTEPDAVVACCSRGTQQATTASGESFNIKPQPVMVKTSGAYSTTEGSVCVHLTCPSMELWWVGYFMSLTSWALMRWNEYWFITITNNYVMIDCEFNLFT